MKFHVNAKGEAGKCSATKGNCPFGGEENHYPTLENAQLAFELSNAGQTLAPAVKKEAVPYPEQNDSVIIHSDAGLFDNKFAAYAGQRARVTDFNGSSYSVRFPDGKVVKGLDHQLVALDKAVPRPGQGRVQYYDSAWGGWRNIDTYGDAETSDMELQDALGYAKERSRLGRTKYRVTSVDENDTEAFTSYANGRAQGPKAEAHRPKPKEIKNPTSPHVHKINNKLMVDTWVEDNVNNQPSCFTPEANNALRNGVAKMYEFAATRKLTRDEFISAAEAQFDKLEAKHGDDGIGDSEPRWYWKDHIDNICGINGWVKEYS